MAIRRQAFPSGVTQVFMNDAGYRPGGVSFRRETP